MAETTFTFCFILLGIFTKGGVVGIDTQQTVWAAVGGQASLSCQLTSHRNVLQVTWQKVFPDGEKNLATYTDRFGSRVIADLKDEMDFQYEDLQSCSMVIRKVKEQDEGCYRCLFNIYPGGALIGRTCLRLYELHEPILDVRRSSSPAEFIISCSASGRPAPTVTLTLPQQNLSFSQYNTTSVSNTNGTVTVTTTALLSASSSTQVGCSVSVLSAAPREQLVIVPGLTETSGDDLDRESSFVFGERQESKDLTVTWIIVAVLVVACICCLAIVPSWIYFKSKNRDREDNKTPQKSSHTHGIKIPLMTVMNEIKQRSSVKKSQEHNSLNTSPLVPRKLF